VIIKFLLTFYCACFICTEKLPGHRAFGITASGARVARGHLACPPEFKFGTMFLIKENGIKLPYFCTDRGRSIKGHRLDIFLPTHHEARVAGVRRKAPVEVVR